MGLFKPAWQSKDMNKALEAIERITDQDLLYEIVCTCEEDKKVLAALNKITCQELLYRISTSAGAFYGSEKALNPKLSTYDQRCIRETATERINDLKLLDKLILQYKDTIYYYIKNAAERRQNELKTTNKMPLEIILASTNQYQAMSELQKLTSDDDLALIAGTAKLDNVRYEAASRLHSQELLLSIAFTAGEMALRIRIADDLTDPQKRAAVYIKILKDYSVREANVKSTLYPLVDKLTSQQALVEVAFNAKSALVRYHAATKLTNKEIALKACRNLARDDSVHDGMRFDRAVNTLMKKIEEDMVDLTGE